MVKLVVQRFSQVLGIGFSETFAPILRREQLQIYLALYRVFNLFIHQINIVDTYLESLLSDNKLSIFIKLLLDIYPLKQVRTGLL